MGQVLHPVARQAAPAGDGQHRNQVLLDRLILRLASTGGGGYKANRYPFAAS
jgi:hypothetical protein